MLHLLRLITVIALMVLALPGSSRGGEDVPAVPEIGKDIPGVDRELLQQGIEKALDNTRKQMPVLPTQEKTGQGANQAKQAMDSFNTPENRQKLQDARALVRKEVLPKKGIPLIPSQETPQKDMVYIFLSGSVPDTAVHAYLTQAALYGGGWVFPVFYGLPNGIGDKRAAGRYFGHVMQEDLECADLPNQRCPRMKVRIKINSALFTQYGISRVPTVVYTNGEDSWELGGDFALDFILTRINGEARSPFLEGLIKNMRGIH